MKRDLRALQDREHDVTVIGGGIAGAWVAWEAASRGLSTALVEQGDFGRATSWSSLKTAHGGLRHLQRADVAGFRESVRERRALLRVAPEVVRPLRFAIAARDALSQAKFFLGGLVNDILSPDRNRDVRSDRALGASRIVSEVEAGGLGGEGLAGTKAFVWEDAQITHTERLLLGVLHAADGAGAAIVNHCEMVGASAVLKGYEIKLQDRLAPGTLMLRSRTIVNAAGAQIESVVRLLGETCGSPKMIRGVNVVFGRAIGPEVAIGAKDRGRFLFLVPWLGRSMLGTIYDDGRAPVESLVGELIEAGKRAFPWANLRRDEVKAVHAGHVPGGSNGEPVYRSRVIGHKNPRALSILTAKYTTARATAEKVVDQLSESLSRRVPPSISALTELKEARPLQGSLADRLAWTQDQEMASNDADAFAGRLVEGALGEAPPG